MRSLATKKLQFPHNFFKYVLFRMQCGHEEKVHLVPLSDIHVHQLHIHFFTISEGHKAWLIYGDAFKSILYILKPHEYSESLGESGDLQNLQEITDNRAFSFSSSSSSAECSGIK